jgi:hypothetical protein
MSENDISYLVGNLANRRRLMTITVAFRAENYLVLEPHRFPSYLPGGSKGMLRILRHT